MAQIFYYLKKCVKNPCCQHIDLKSFLIVLNTLDLIRSNNLCQHPHSTVLPSSITPTLFSPAHWLFQIPCITSKKPRAPVPSRVGLSPQIVLDAVCAFQLGLLVTVDYVPKNGSSSYPCRNLASPPSYFSRTSRSNATDLSEISCQLV